MTTAADFVKDTLLLLQVVNVQQPVSAADIETGIRSLNRYCTRLEANGTSLGWSNVDNPSDVLPLPPEAELPVMYGLALDIAPQYGVTPLPSVVGRSIEYTNDLLRDQAVATPIQPILDAPWPYTWGQRGWANLWNGGW
jgi:hypothetical protein